MRITEHQIKLSRGGEFDDERKKFDAVLIIGNGFDLSFGLKTSYNDFVESNEFNDLLLIKNQLALYLKSQKDLNNWIDVENELANYSNLHLEKANDFLNDFNKLSFQLKKYLETIVTFGYNQDSMAFKLIENIIDYKTLILDFNYTDTLDLILTDLLGEFHKESVHHIKIHGSIESEIIFGIDDKATIYEDHIFLKKSVNKNYKTLNIDKFLSESNSIGVFGHSLGETDHMYFNKFFTEACKVDSISSGKEISLYYYDEKARLELHKQLDVLTKKDISKFKRNNSVEFIKTE